MKLTEPYDPCPCGSGKKYKFCCYQKRNDTYNPFAARSHSPAYTEDIYADLLVEDEENCLESFRLSKKGLKLMHRGNLEDAMFYFREAITVMPQIYTPANNLSVCLMALGRLDEAIQVQKESLKVSRFPNPFGQANMATFLYINGDEIGCRRNIDEALRLKMPSGDACVKVCEVLARLRRHQDIIDLVDQYDFVDAPDIFFFSGVAAANLGDFERAKSDLLRLNFGFHKADMVRRYLQHIKEGTQPHTIRGDWPYVLSPNEVCPISLLPAGMQTDYDRWVNRRVAADFCETSLNELVQDWNSIFALLASIKHPEAVNLLWLIVKGRFGPDSLRMNAAQELGNRGELAKGQKIKMFIKGKTADIVLDGINLNPDFRFGNKLPQKLDKKYEKAVIACSKKKVDWVKLGQVFLEVLTEVPDYYPARFNYAISLLHSDKKNEALPILRDLVEKHPDYLFARGTLLQLLSGLKLDDEAEALIQSTDLPKETHPAAFATWMVSQAVYHEEAARYDDAYECARAAHDCAPQMESVKRLWKNYADWEEDEEEAW